MALAGGTNGRALMIGYDPYTPFLGTHTHNYHNFSFVNLELPQFSMKAVYAIVTTKTYLLLSRIFRPYLLLIVQKSRLINWQKTTV